MRHQLDRAHDPVRPLVGLCLALCALLPAYGPALADTTLPTTLGAEEEGPLTFPQTEQLEVELDDVVVMALRHNLSLVVERYRRQGTLLGIREAMGIYDLNLNATLETSSSTRPPNSTLEAADIVVSDRDRWNFSLTQLTRWGGTAAVTFNNTLFESSNQAVQPNPQYESTFTVGFDQPLLRNFGREVTERSLIVARNNVGINLEVFRTQVETIVQQVADNYWNLAEAKEQLKVSLESLELAKELHEMNRIQVEVGTMAPLEMVQSEVGVATREEQIIRDRAAVQDAEDALRRLANLEQGDLWDVEIVPTTNPEIAHEPIDVAEAVRVAASNRPDVIRRKLENETLALDSRISENATKPTLDLEAGYGYNSLAGDEILPDGQEVSGGWSDALDQIADGDFDSWRVTLTFGYPIQNRAARAAAARAELAAKQGEYELRDLLGQVLLEVRRTARGVDTAAKAIESAKVSSKLARKNLEAEQKRYENGLSTSFQVLEIQEDLSQARSREVSAIIGYRRALTAYQQATGQLLDAYAIELENGDSAEATE
ncbi:MAG: TolC family protein [Acidobacteriota bacterium]